MGPTALRDHNGAVTASDPGEPRKLGNRCAEFAGLDICTLLDMGPRTAILPERFRSLPNSGDAPGCSSRKSLCRWVYGQFPAFFIDLLNLHWNTRSPASPRSTFIQAAPQPHRTIHRARSKEEHR
uniref:(northern house mosquito) hypothetical protein n=1 Tax=Culex pipiens TaxID=7175 RepID=A0A8D8JXT8_CULPI